MEVQQYTIVTELPWIIVGGLVLIGLTAAGIYGLPWALKKDVARLEAAHAAAMSLVQSCTVNLATVTTQLSQTGDLIRELQRNVGDLYSVTTRHGERIAKVEAKAGD